MLSLYEILKASKTGIAPDMWTALAGMNWGGAGSGAKIKELTGIPPLSFRADGTPLLDFLISGNMVQSGTPTPSSPIQPQECGERTGNMCNPIPYKNNYYINENGVETHFSGFDIYKVTATAQTKYTLSLNTSLSGSTVRIHSYSNGSWTEQIVAPTVRTLPITFTTPQDCDEIRFSITNNALNHIMLNEGSIALPYEPYGQYKIPILSANTTTPVYLGEVQTTRKIKKLVLDGANEEEWKKPSKRTGSFYLNVGTNAITGLGLCNRAINVDTIQQYDSSGKMFIESSGSSKLINLWLFDTDISLADFKTYLQQQYANGTPVCVWYVLATPTTGIVNEPLRKIGVYADTLSMEQAGVQIPTNRGNTVIDVDTTLKPSEVYIKYKG